MSQKVTGNFIGVWQRFRLVLPLLVLLAADPVRAQGVLHGTVRDSTTADELIGVNVSLVGTALGGVTDVDGNYRVASIPSGTYTVRFSYLGYAPREVQVTIASGQTRRLDVRMAPSDMEAEELVVTTQRSGQAAAINQQLNANTIVNVISEERIQELPDANAAEAIGRLPGVALQRSGGEANRVVLRGMSDRFSSITVDGIRIAPTDADARSVDLSTISQGTLSGVELYKAITPDKDGDAIAGSVNLVTKRAPAERFVRAEGRGAYNALKEALGQYDFVARYGERFLGNMLGVQATANIEQRDRSKENVDVDFDVRGINSGSTYRLTDLNVRFTDELRRRQGGSLILDLITPDGGGLKLSGLFNQTQRDYIEYARNYPTDSDELLYGARDREQTINTLSTSLTGENYLLGFGANWGLSYARSKSFFPFDYDVAFTEPSSLGPDRQPASGMRPIPDSVLRGAPEGLVPYALNNFEKAYFYTAYFRDQRARDAERTAFLDLSRPYTFGRRVTGALKVGGKYRSKDRSRSMSELLSPYYNEPLATFSRSEDGAVVAKDFSGTRFSNLATFGGKILSTNFLDASPQARDVYGRYRLYPIFNRDALRLWWALNREGYSDQAGTNPEYERNLEPDALYYNVTERVGAAYVMNTLNLGRAATLIAGVRVEQEDNDYASRFSPRDLSGFPVPKGSIRDTSAAHRETVWLPNVQLAVRPTGFLTVRGAAYKALARPDFNMRLENFVARKSGTFYSGNSLIIGNPGLKAAVAWNYEVNTTLYGRYVGLFSVSAFQKDVEGMFQMMNGLPFTDDSALDSLGISYRNPFQGTPFALTYPYNSTKPTKVWGLEVEHQADLSFLPGVLKNVVLSYNVSLVRSRTYVPSTRVDTFSVTIPGFPFPIPQSRSVFIEVEQKLQGQPDLFGNVALGYDYRGFSGRLSLFHQGEYNRSFSSDGRTDSVHDAYTRWDLAFRQNVGRRLALTLNINNLTGAQEGTSTVNRVQGWRLINTGERYGTTVDLGLRVTL
ncbi:MAG TPA: TonB-dependent receptor [Rhodothermales bacterium]|nr:TonB-dependent receptor [Rhodothermales bacterium]